MYIIYIIYIIFEDWLETKLGFLKFIATNVLISCNKPPRWDQINHNHLVNLYGPIYIACFRKKETQIASI